MITVIERARRYIAKCPVAISGQRGHDATFLVASVLVWGFALSEADTLTLLQEWNRACVPPWSGSELLHKVKSVAGVQHRKARGYLIGENGNVPGGTIPPQPSPPTERVVKPIFCPMVLKRIAAKTTVDVVAFLAERSPVRVETQDSASVVRRLYAFGSGEKILIFSDMRSQGQLLWEADRSDLIQNRHLPIGEEGVWFLPQPVDGLFHPNPRTERRKLSRRSEESVVSWRYLVLESDEADPEDWLRCLIQMPLRIVSVCESGRRSIHALVRFDADTKADWDAKVRVIRPALVTLGADPGALSAVRLTRLPQAKRGERLQGLLYLNPSPGARAIADLMKEGR